MLLEIEGGIALGSLTGGAVDMRDGIPERRMNAVRIAMAEWM